MAAQLGGVMRWLMGVLFGGLCFGGVAAAHPTMAFPEVSSGDNPYRSFGGTVPEGSTTPVLLTEVPVGQEFIVTMVNVRDGSSAILQDDTTLLSGFIIGRGTDNAISRGRGGIRVTEGTSLYIQGDGTYFVQGHFVKAGSPYRSFYGAAPAYTTTTIFTADSDRAFVVRTLHVTSTACQVYIDDALHLDSVNYSTLYGGFAQGYGALVVPAGSRFQIKGESSATCDYYIDGEYIPS